VPAMTLGTLLSEATAALGNRTEIPLSVMSLHANLAQLEVASMLPQLELMSTTTLVLGAGSQSTNLPADFAEVVNLSRPNSYDAMGYRNLSLVPSRVIDNASEGTTAGTTDRFAVIAGSILFFPPPASTDTFLLRYIKTPSDMTALTALPSLATRYHPAILYKLIENVADRAVDNARAAYYRDKFLSVMGTIPTPDAVESRASS
jgi:hypothetical protein